MKRSLSLLLTVLFACEPPDPTVPTSPPGTDNGTFVGNPTLVARYLDNPVQVGMGGRLVTSSTAIEPCDGGTVGVGPQTFTFDGTQAMVELELPEVEICSILIAALELAITVDDNGTAKTIIGQDFDFRVDASIIPADQRSLELRLGDASWLQSFVPLAPAGEIRLNSDARDDLFDAFFDGLNDGSSFEAIPSVP